MLGRAVRDQIVRRGSNSPAWVLLNVAEVFQKADLAFVNLEAPFQTGPNPEYNLIFRASPEHVSALTSAGIDVVSFANNHSRNQGAAGIRTTLDLLGKRRIAVAGAGLTSKQAYAPQYLRAASQPVAVLAYTYSERTLTKDSAQPTIAALDTTVMQAEVHKAVRRGAFVIVSMHAGAEYTRTPNRQQVAFAHDAIDAGAGLVVGHHPHWAQNVETYRGRPILYSLGNLVFDQGWSAETQQGAVAVAQVENRRVVRLQLRPVKIEHYAQPRWMTPAEAAAFFRRTGLSSRPYTYQ